MDEVAALLEKLNYFRVPHRQWDERKKSWFQVEGYASDRLIQEALDGKRTIGLLAGYQTSFLCFDIDVPGKDEAASEREFETREHLRRAELGNETPMADWFPKAAGFDLTWVGSVGPELRAAVDLVKSLFNQGPSFVVRSPNGVHAYWCFDQWEPWSVVQDIYQKVKVSFGIVAGSRSINRKVEGLPTPVRTLRVPRKDSLLDPETLEPLSPLGDGASFWRNVKTFSLSYLVKLDVLEDYVRSHKVGLRRAGLEETRTFAVGGLGSGIPFGNKPKSRAEAERRFLPLVNGETFEVLPILVEAAKRDGCTVDETVEWLQEQIELSHHAGYEGDLGRDESGFHSRVAGLYGKSTPWDLAGTDFWYRLWVAESGKYPLEFGFADRALAALEVLHPLAKASRPTVRRFLANLEVWKKIIDAKSTEPGVLNAFTVEARARGSYPLQGNLLEKLYSGYKQIWKDLQATGVLIKDPTGLYSKKAGRPQYYFIR